MMDRSLKALSLILSYPTGELQEAMGAIGQVLAEDVRLAKGTRESVRLLAASLASDDLYDLQERFVSLFDRSRTLALNLFEHVHGESRDRGSAMVSLLETYRDAGFEPTGAELPDHLPVLLEFLSVRPAAEAREILADAAHILEALGTRLGRRGSPYQAAFRALLDLSRSRADREALAALLEQPDEDPADLDALDAQWEETPVTFGTDPNGGCPQVREVLARMEPPGTRAPGDSRHLSNGGSDA